MTSTAPLRSRTFRHLAAAYSVNELGDWIGDLALAVLVYDRTSSAIATAALFFSLRIVPAFLAPLLAARIEVLPPRTLLPAILLLEAAIFATIAALASSFSLTVVLVLAAADGVLAIAGKAVTRAATAALLLPQGRLREGNAILNMGFAAGGAIGPVIAGLLVGSLGPGSALLADAATFVLVAVILATADELRLDTDRSTTSGGRLRTGLREAWGRVAVRRLLVAQALALVFFSAVVPVEVVYVKRSLHGTDAGYGALMAAWGFGMVIGGVAYARASGVRLLTVIVLSTALVGAGYGGEAFAPNLLVACAFAVVGGIGNGAQWIAVATAVQQAVSSVAQSSVAALLGSINQVMPVIGFLLGGAVATLASPRVAYATAAAGVAVVLVALAVRRPVGLDTVGAADALAGVDAVAAGDADAGPVAQAKATGSGASA